ncbi:hypothetical protein [Kineosporia babensis]|uniref:Uncharacterized protein n=1 Tax=Kineosporia babensis TaxID=499548 RepID=A0A9X1STQ8_9ACTN|nr:hypothetical protein [Kineosporia babensis]MCD5311591.1 hypothetical protein [Kineosporia babensis]
MAIGNDDVILLEEVIDELTRLATLRTDMAPFAALALKNLGPLSNTRFGPLVPGLRSVARADVYKVQQRIADPAQPRHDDEHLAESVAIALMQKAMDGGSQKQYIFLTEDFEARAAAFAMVRICFPWSTPRLLWERVDAEELGAEQAAAIAAQLKAAGRCGDISLREFEGSTPRGLGRAGQP